MPNKADPSDQKGTFTMESAKMQTLTKKKERDFTDRLETFLAKRDGVDKLLKIARYSAKIVLGSSVLPPKSEIEKRVRDFEGSVGLSRKAFRLGKFIQDYNALKKSESSLMSREGVLEIVAYGGEGVYYFVEQITWLIKTGLIDKRYAARFNKLSAWAEFMGYCGSIALKFLQIAALKDQENGLLLNMCEGDEEIVRKKIKEAKEKQVLKMVSIVQDVADGLLALVDIRDAKDLLSNPVVLASAGLLSALISAHKNWSSS